MDDEQLTISTPEQVAFHYEIAGIGSRFLASLLDHLIISVALLLVYCASIAVLPAMLATDNGEAVLYLIVAVLVLVVFIIFWGYFAIFEAVWNGQTPGKRAGRLRVIRRTGQPIGASEAMVRNLIRIVDFMPGFYGIGLISMFIDKEARRLGDFAAGTIIIREGEQTRLQDVRVSNPTPYSQPTYSPYQTSYTAPDQLSTQHSALSTRYDPLPGISLREVTADDYRLMRELVQRVRRGELARDRGYNLASQMAQGVAARMGHDFREWQRRGWDPLVFLESVLTSRDARGE
ncbi:MAG TPA: RDD family protein [Chloroflexia bacterium]|jgi:uncharacterized RDD family membrane protein YckC